MSKLQDAPISGSPPDPISTFDYKAAGSIYDFTVKDTNGEDVKLDIYKDKVVLIVNIASQCGLTKNNYKKLTNLKNVYGERGFQILSFPCNQFGGQMPEADGEEMVCSLKNANAEFSDVFLKDTNGENVKLDIYKDKVVLIVNIASQCGLTKNNYKKLTNLKNLYGENGLQILSFPCNQFGGQMPEADGEEMVCSLKNANADVGDVFLKINVNGNNASPLYKYLKHKQTGTLGSSIKWNFTKFLIDKNGQPVGRFAPTTDPMDIAKSIEKLL